MDVDAPMTAREGKKGAEMSEININTSLPTCPVGQCWNCVPHWHAGNEAGPILPGYDTPDPKDWRTDQYGFHTRTYGSSARAIRRIEEICARALSSMGVPDYGTLTTEKGVVRPATPEEWAHSVPAGLWAGEHRWFWDEESQNHVEVKGGDFDAWRVGGWDYTHRYVILHRPTGGVAVIYRRDGWDHLDSGDYAPGVTNSLSREHKHPREWGEEVFTAALRLASQDACLFTLEEALYVL